jgi:cobalamin biosynthesis protein CobT
MSEIENPLEPFKRATTATVRAIAGDDELEITFGPGAPAAHGDRQWRVSLRCNRIKCGLFALLFKVRV